MGNPLMLLDVTPPQANMPEEGWTYEGFKKFVNDSTISTFSALSGIPNPYAVFVTDDGTVICAITTPIAEGSTDIFASALQDILKNYKVEILALVSETWVVNAKENEDALDVPPSEHPDRQEKLMISFTKKGDNASEVLLGSIITDKVLGRYISKWETINADATSGRLAFCL